MEHDDVQLDMIRLDGGTQPRSGLNEQHVAELMADVEAGEELPPIGLVFDGEHYWPWDGFHRIAACTRLDHVRISAEVRQGTRRDAVLLSVGANAEHNALRRTNADKRRAVMTLLNDAEWAKWSGREIARRCRVGETLVREIRESLREKRSDDVEPDPVTYTTKHGTTATMNTAGINAGRKLATVTATVMETVDTETGEVVDGDASSAPRNEVGASTPEQRPVRRATDEALAAVDAIVELVARPPAQVSFVELRRLAANARQAVAVALNGRELP